MSQILCHFFGSPRIERAEAAITIGLRKGLALLVYLAVTGQPHTRDALAALFWPEDSQSTARGNLRRALSRLNTALGAGALQVDRETAGLAADGLWMDVDQFRRCLARCATHGHPAGEVCDACLPELAEAAGLYRNHFLAGFSLPDCPEFDEWQYFEGEELRHGLASTLERLARGYDERGDHAAALPYARRWLALDTLHEPAHRCLMQLYARSNQPSAALRQYEECVRILGEELGAEPSPETTSLFESIKAGRHLSPVAPVPHPVPPVPHAATTPHHLPSQPTPLVGREAELAAIVQRLTDPECRLLTLAGVGGIGKTRLALAAATRLLSDGQFPGGIHFVPLAALDAPELLAAVIAEAFDLDLHSGEATEEQLIRFLTRLPQPALLVLDNFEQLVAGADLLADMAARAPALTILVTSRERLNLRAEWVLEVGGLAFPDSLTTDAPLESFEAARLFLQAATRADAGFALKRGDTAHVLRICRLLEGMPLGLELASSWVRVLSCQEIAHEIAASHAFLTTSLRDMPSRHRSLAAVFDNSWRLLSPTEQLVFRTLSVFRGGFTLEAAQQVAGAPLSTLAALADKSMLRRNKDGRFELHELLRQFGGDKLLEAGETEQARDRHLAFFLALAEQAEPQLQGRHQARWMQALNDETGNLRAALAWSLDGRRTESGLRLAAALGLYWFMRGQLFDESADWLTKIVAAARPASQSAVQAKALLWLGQFAHFCGDDASGRVAFEQSLALFRALGDSVGAADALLYLADIAAFEGDEPVAAALYAEARSAYEQGLPALRARGDHWTLARSLNYLGEIARSEDDLAAAQRFYEDSLAVRRALGDQRGMAVTLFNLGQVLVGQGDGQQATDFYLESLALSRSLGDQRGLPDCLVGLGGAAAITGQPERAARLFGAAEILFQESVPRLDYPDQVQFERNVAAVRDQLGEAVYAACHAAGRTMALEAIIAEASAGKVTDN